MNTSKFYDEWAATYDTDRNRTRDLDEQVLRETLGGMRVSSILELGCGTGKNTMLLAQLGEDVEAYDFSANMIEQAKSKLSAKSSIKNVRFLQTDITSSWAREDKSVDLLACNLVLEHIEDLSTVFEEAQRVLRDGGLFFVSELHPFRQYQGVKANFTRTSSKTRLETAETRWQDEQPRIENGSTAFESVAFVHHISDFIKHARANRLVVDELNEWWHQEDAGGPPRLVTFFFRKELMNRSGTSASSR